MGGTRPQKAKGRDRAHPHRRPHIHNKTTNVNQGTAHTHRPQNHQLSPPPPPLLTTTYTPTQTNYSPSALQQQTSSTHNTTKQTSTKPGHESSLFVFLYGLLQLRVLPPDDLPVSFTYTFVFVCVYIECLCVCMCVCVQAASGAPVIYPHLTMHRNETNDAPLKQPKRLKSNPNTTTHNTPILK